MRHFESSAGKVVLASLAALLAVGCGGGTDVGEFDYGEGQPGSDLEEGGEVLLERIGINVGEGAATVGQFHAYQFDSGQEGTLRAENFPPPGQCVSLREGDTWPTQTLPGDAEYVNWGDSIRLSSAEAGLDVTVPKVLPAQGESGVADNRPNFNRWDHPFIYGGPTWQGDNLDPADIQNDVEYTVDLDGEQLSFVFPPSHTPPLGIGSDGEPVVVPAEGDWEVTWPTLDQAPGDGHTREKHFTFLAFAEVTDSGPIATGLCNVAEDGIVNVPRSFIESNLVDAGVIQHGRLTHYMEKLGGRRFDLVAIDCYIGTYQIEGTQ